MSEHYYTENPVSAHDEREIQAEINGAHLSFVTDAGVFSRSGIDAGSRLLIEDSISIEGNALDMGCGWGAVGISVIKCGGKARFTFSDINRRAADLCRRNLEKNGISGCTVVCGEGFTQIEGKFDHILLNPPIRAGKDTIYRLFAEAKDHLLPGGKLHIVILSRQGADSALKKMRELFGNGEITSRGGGYKVIVSEAGETAC